MKDYGRSLTCEARHVCAPGVWPHPRPLYSPHGQEEEEGTWNVARPALGSPSVHPPTLLLSQRHIGNACTITERQETMMKVLMMETEG